MAVECQDVVEEARVWRRGGEGQAVEARLWRGRPGGGGQVVEGEARLWRGRPGRGGGGQAVEAEARLWSTSRKADGISFGRQGNQDRRCCLYL